MGVHKKVLFGFILIGFILFLSGLVSVFEVTRMRDKVSGVLSENVEAVLNACQLESVTKKCANVIFNNLQSDSLSKQLLVMDKDLCENYFSQLSNSHLHMYHTALLDSLFNAYYVYTAVLNEAPEVWKSPRDARSEWTTKRFFPAYTQFCLLLERTMMLSQESLEKNSQEIESGFYRSIMPGVIATGAGIILVILFNYFINLYIVVPVLNITKGVNAYLTNRIPYRVDTQNEDELQELNHAIKTLINECKSLAKSKQQ